MLCHAFIAACFGTYRRGRRHECRTIRVFGHYGERNHQGLENRIIEAEFTSTSEGSVECRERLGGLLRYYYRKAA